MRVGDFGISHHVLEEEDDADDLDGLHQPSARPPLCCTPLYIFVGVEVGMERERQQNDGTLADGG